jgi:hypothetical protein
MLWLLKNSILGNLTLVNLGGLGAATSLECTPYPAPPVWTFEITYCCYLFSVPQYIPWWPWAGALTSLSHPQKGTDR